MGDMNKKTEVQRLTEILTERDMLFTIKDIQELMDSELVKDPSEMDTELIDLCASVIGSRVPAAQPKLMTAEEIENMIEEFDAEYAKANENLLAKEADEVVKETVSESEAVENTENDSSAAKPIKFSAKRKVKVFKILLVAAVVVSMLVVGIPASARLFDTEASDSILKFYKDHFRIDLRSAEDKEADARAADNDLVNSLILESLDSLMLPQLLLSDEYEKEVSVQQDEFVTSIYLLFNNSEISGNILITRYKDKTIDKAKELTNVSNQYDYFKEIDVSNVNVIVFGSDKKSYICYSNNYTAYNICLNNDFNSAVLIANSIK